MCDQSRTQRSRLKLPAKETFSILHLGDAYLLASGNSGAVVLDLAPESLSQTTWAMQEGLRVAV